MKTNHECEYAWKLFPGCVTSTVVIYGVKQRLIFTIIVLMTGMCDLFCNSVLMRLLLGNNYGVLIKLAYNGTLDCNHVLSVHLK